VAGGALNGTWRPQGGRAAAPRPQDTEMAVSRDSRPCGAQITRNFGLYARTHEVLEEICDGFSAAPKAGVVAEVAPYGRDFSKAVW